MAFNPDPNPDRFDQVLNAPVAHYLGCQPGRDAEQVLAVLSIRMAPTISFASETFSLTKNQAMRLRDDLNSLLTEPGSWLYSPPEEPPRT